MLFVLIFGHVSTAQNSQTVTLDKCLQIALENNFSMQIARNENEIAKNNYTKANAGLLPVVDAVAGYAGSLNSSSSENFDETKTSANFRLGNAASASVNASWDIFSGFKAQSKYAQLKELKEISDLTVRLKVESLITSVASEYYYLIQQEKYKNNLEYTLDISKERLRIVSINYELGSGSKFEVSQARVDFNSDSSALVRQKQQIYAAKIRLQTLLGNIKDKIKDKNFVPDSLIRLLPELEYSELLEQSIRENTQLMIAARQINVSEYDIKIMRSNTLPYVRLNSGYGFSYNAYNKGVTKNSFNTGFDYGVTVGINLYNGNTKREIKNAMITKKNRELALEESQLDVEARVKEIYSSYINNLALIKVERQNLKTAVQNFEIAIERYRLGELAGISMREAQTSLREAEKRLLDVEFNAKTDEISLMALSGNVEKYL
ncbi:MAG: TolC family protein [Prevotellaceae bacterium]|nr:TolC family protein [Prevotellaceae bacterium]